ncbi:MAG: HlyD family efflux transporter periplasmic adaptor subunit, partial [Planctomycetes bacterium]|nr:HlyD family efflux transporter periplasmic adaptor subunit [Planctomycetota bacterium]
VQEHEDRLAIVERDLEAVTRLFEMGYKSPGDMAEAKLNALRARSALARQQAKRRELVEYEHEQSTLRMTGKVQSADRAVVQVAQDNEAYLAQAKSWMESSARTLEREEDRLARYRAQLDKCKIYAPQDGMVAYAVESDRWGSSSTIAEGVAVRERQHLLSIPDLKHAQVKTAVHESVVDRVKAGMNATVRVEAFPNRQFDATVKSVSVLPNPGGWLSSDAKVYDTLVVIDEQVEHLKPGMTAVVELYIDHLYDVVCVPVQALIQRGAETWCYVARDNQIQKQPVDLGLTNDRLVEVRSGLDAGDTVVLNADAVLEMESDATYTIAPDTSREVEASLH